MIRHTLHAALFAATLAALPAPRAVAQDTAPESTEECTCTCAACMERHGKTSAEPEPEGAVIADVPTAVIIEDVVEAPEVRVRLLVPPAKPVSPAKPVNPAKPVDPAKPMARQATGAQDRPILGVQIGAGPDGVEVAQVMEGLAADKAGIQAGDTIFSIGGRTVLDLEELREQLESFKGGDEVTVGIIRNERPLSLELTLGTAAEVAQSTRPGLPNIARAVPSPTDAADEGREIRGVAEVVEVGEPVEGSDFFVGKIVLPTEPPAPARLVAPPVAPSTGVGETPPSAPRLPAEGRPAPMRGRAIAPRVEYVEVETEIRRERRPVVIGASEEDLRRELEELRAEIAELRAQVDEMKRELDRRSLR